MNTLANGGSADRWYCAAAVSLPLRAEEDVKVPTAFVGNCGIIPDQAHTTVRARAAASYVPELLADEPNILVNDNSGLSRLNLCLHCGQK